MKISIGSDHGGYELKTAIVAHLENMGYSVVDVGTHSSDRCDYPDYAAAAARLVASGECDRGIVICTTGIGVSISANKIKGIRCALLCDVISARMTRSHNDTNMMALGAAMIQPELAIQLVDIWLSTPFSGEPRHQQRVDKIMALEN